MVYIPKSKVKIGTSKIYGGKGKRLISKAPKITGTIGNLLKRFKNK